MKTKLFILLAAFCCSVTAMAQDDIDDERKSIYDDGFVKVDGIWYRHNMYDEDVDHYYASVIGPEEMDPDEYYDAFAITIYYEGDVVIPASIRVNGANIPVEGIGYRAFCDRPGGSGGPAEIPLVNGPRRMPAPGPAFPVTSVTLPNSLRWISDEAFEGCSTLKSISFGNGLESIGWWAFSGCSGLTSISIPASVTEISSEAFSGCNGLTSISVASGNTKYDSPNNCNAIIEKSSKKLMTGCVNTVIPEDVRVIGKYAFYRCSDLTSIKLPNSLERIEDKAFYDCSGLTSIVFPQSVKSIEAYAFSGCSSLTSIHIPQNVKNIGKNAFGHNLNSITVASGNTMYDSRNNCNAIIETSSNNLIIGCNNTVIPENVKSIGDDAFSGSSLITFIVPNSVESIGYSAFYHCKNLASIVIGSKVSSYGSYAFGSCDNLREVTVLNPTPVSILKSVFPNRTKQMLFVPKGSKDAYKNADIWKEFNMIAEIGTSPEVVKGDMNGDGVLTIIDALIIIEMILSNQ